MEREVQRRQKVLFDLGIADRFRQQQLQAQAWQRQAEQDALAKQRYEQERSDRLMARADAQADKYQQAELNRVQREEDQRQRNLDRADAAATRYQDAELRRQENEAQRQY